MTSLLLNEIHEQPAVIERLIAMAAAPIAAIAQQISTADIRYVVIAARGTSDNAARYAQYVFGALNGLTVALATPSLFTVFERPPRLAGALVIGISQSGQSPDIVGVVAEARRQGVPTIAITNDPQSPLGTAAQHCIALNAGVERSVAATKTYTAQLAALALLAAQMRADGSVDQLALLPAALQAALGSNDMALAAAQRLASANRCVVLGRGYNYATAFEIALKIKELTYVAAEPYSSADFEHGPIAIVEPGFPAVLVAVGPTLRDEMLALRDRLHERGATTVVLGDDPTQRQPDDLWLPVPATPPEWLSPIAAIVPGQLLAYHLAHSRGFDPDQPRALQKVTLTR